MKAPVRPLPDRRKALKRFAVWLLAGSGGIIAGWLALGREGAIDEWVDAGDVASLPAGQISARQVSVTAQGKWLFKKVDRVVWIYRKPDGDLVVLSGICPHKNYNINWRRDLGNFVCPGHKSAFAPTGEVLSGPSPRPLDALEHRVDNGILKVRYQKFRQNIPAREVFA